jgi:hypothetical protein
MLTLSFFAQKIYDVAVFSQQRTISGSSSSTTNKSNYLTKKREDEFNSNTGNNE